MVSRRGIDPAKRRMREEAARVLNREWG